MVLDLETTGLGDGSEIVAIAVVGGAGSVLLDTMVRPRNRIPEDARRVHGLSDEEVATAPGLSTVYENLLRVTRDRIVVAFNAAFDRAILDSECRRLHLQPIAGHWECALQHYIEWRGFSAPLATIREIEGLPGRTSHRASDDALTTWDLVARMAR